MCIFRGSAYESAAATHQFLCFGVAEAKLERSEKRVYRPNITSQAIINIYTLVELRREREHRDTREEEAASS